MIPAREELLKSLMAEAEKPRKVVKFKNLYRYGSVAAAAVILIVAAIELPGLWGGVKENLAINDLAVNDIAESGAAKQEDSYEEAAAETENLKKDITADTADVTKEYSAPISVENQISTEPAPSAQSQKLALAEEEAAADEAESVEDFPVAAYSANDTAAMMRGFGGETPVGKSVSVDEYLAMFDFDLSGIILPEGVNRTDEVIFPDTDSDGNTVFSERTISYSGEGKSLWLTVSQDMDFVSGMIDENPDSKVSENISIVDGGDGNLTAYVKGGSGAYIADCINFSVNEVKALAFSLK